NRHDVENERVLQVKGVVTHPDPESYTVSREAESEAQTGARTGRVLSCERKLQGVDPITNGEDHTSGGANTKSPRTSGNIMHENRDKWSASAAQSGGRPVGEGESRTTHRHAGQESDSGVVPEAERGRQA